MIACALAGDRRLHYASSAAMARALSHHGCGFADAFRNGDDISLY